MRLRVESGGKQIWCEMKDVLRILTIDKSFKEGEETASNETDAVANHECAKARIVAPIKSSADNVASEKAFVNMASETAAAEIAAAAGKADAEKPAAEKAAAETAAAEKPAAKKVPAEKAANEKEANEIMAAKEASIGLAVANKAELEKAEETAAEHKELLRGLFDRLAAAEEAVAARRGSTQGQAATALGGAAAHATAGGAMGSTHTILIKDLFRRLAEAEKAAARRQGFPQMPTSAAAGALGALVDRLVLAEMALVERLAAPI